MRYPPHLAAALLAGLGALGGVEDPLGESKRALYDEFPHPAYRPTRHSRAPKEFDRAAARKKNKTARKARVNTNRRK